MESKKDGRAIAQQNEVRVLRALHRFGFLQTRLIAVLVWTGWSREPANEPTLQPPIPTSSGLRMAQRTLCRLRDKRLVLSSRAPDGSTIYALAEAGARQLRGIGIPALTGKDLVRTFSTAHFRHRAIASEVAVSAILEGFRVSSEHEIARGDWLGGDKGIAGKKPDATIRGAGRIWLIEVEKSRKNAKDYSKLLEWLGVVVRDAFRPAGQELLGDGLRWGKVIFVCTRAFRDKLLRDLTAAGWKKNHLEALIGFNCELYRTKEISFS